MDLDDLEGLALVTEEALQPAEVFIEGETRTVLHYLLEPLTLVLNRAGRER